MAKRVLTVVTETPTEPPPPQAPTFAYAAFDQYARQLDQLVGYTKRVTECLEEFDVATVDGVAPKQSSVEIARRYVTDDVERLLQK